MRQTTKNQETAVCSIDYAFRRLGGKYKARILMYLWHNKVLRYGELRRTITDITPKMLTQTLRELEEDKLVDRTVYNEKPPKVEYTITGTALRLIPFILELRTWGDSLLAGSDIPVLPPVDCREFEWRISREAEQNAGL